ncbi:MAG: hypothetical protein NTY79_00560 [Chloroflexi bacterium]|nr:hypothetical protein [Chloroflexota bacterium]
MARVTAIIFSLVLLPICVLYTALPGCSVPPSTSPGLPPPPAQPVLSPGGSPRFFTIIYEGPSGTINYNAVTFKWGSGLSSVDPSNFTYATFLQGYDNDFTPFLKDTSRSFQGLPNGNFIFYAKAQDSSGNIEPNPPFSAFTVSGVVPPQAAQNLPVVPGGGGFLLIGSDVSRIAVGSDGLTIYALDSTNSRLYRSDSAGAGWRDISAAISGAAPWTDLSIAPDDARFVAVVTNGGREIYISADSGANFSGTGVSSILGAGQAVTCISLSPDYGAPRRELAAGTWSGTGGGTVLINMLTGFSGGWFDAGRGASGWLSEGGGVDVFALKHSPSFASDGAMLLVASSAARTYLYIGARDLGSRTTTWNSSTGYPVEIGQAGSPLNYADIALPADYSPANPYARQVFASWSKNITGQDIYRISDYQVYRMGAPEAISSIAYYGSVRSGKLLAGAARCQGGGGCYQVQTYFSANAVSNYPAWQPSQKAPTGSRAAMVRWSPDGNMAYAGTSGTESAFSHSKNDGNTWNQ